MQIGFFGLLTLVFVIAKLAGWIAWSWWLVFSPLLVGVVVTAAIVVFATVFATWAKYK